MKQISVRPWNRSGTWFFVWWRSDQSCSSRTRLTRTREPPKQSIKQRPRTESRGQVALERAFADGNRHTTCCLERAQSPINNPVCGGLFCGGEPDGLDPRLRSSATPRCPEHCQHGRAPRTRGAQSLSPWPSQEAASDAQPVGPENGVRSKAT